MASPEQVRLSGSPSPRVNWEWRQWSRSAWAAAGATVAFIGLTCWWLTQDRSVPVYDAGYHLGTAVGYHDQLAAGDVLQPFTHASIYPPLGHLVGALAAFIGGVNVASPIIGENLVFVSLLTLGCYQTGRLLFGPRAGLLAVAMALGSPLLISQFHVFMLDAPETALVAVSIWLLLASQEFRHTRIAAWAGLAVGLGMLVKVTFPFYVVGVVLVALARGGWRRRPGVAAFAAVVFVVAAPWYLYHLSELHAIDRIAGYHGPSESPPTVSVTNFGWYFWAALNSLLFAPLFLLALVGTIWTIFAVGRDRIASGPALALLAGALLAWLAMTLITYHEVSAVEPLLPYLAVIGAGSITYLAAPARLAATGVLVVAVAANTLATTFGVGGTVKVASSHPGGTPDPRAGCGGIAKDQLVLYSSAGFCLVAGPHRDGDVPGLLRALRRDGVRVLALGPTAGVVNGGPGEFTKTGLSALAKIARIEPSREPVPAPDPTVAALVHQATVPGGTPPCTRLTDGSGVWVLRFDTARHKFSYYCPFPHPRSDVIIG
jgi:hypothetical protein